MSFNAVLIPLTIQRCESIENLRLCKYDKLRRLMRQGLKEYQIVGITLTIFPQSHKGHKEISIDSKHFMILASLWDAFLKSNQDTIP
jgi:hypothetical protein